MWGIEGALEASTSSRIKGLALDMHLSKKSRVPAHELSDLQLYSLEACLSDARSTVDEKLASGTLLWMAYMRNRSSDICRLAAISIDRSPNRIEHGFIEASLVGPKNARSTAMKTDLLPIAGSIAGLGASKFGPWFDHYEAARSDAGLASIIRTDSSRAVLWPKRSTSGHLVETIDCTSQDLGIALKNILSKFGWHRDDLQNHSSHSMKATLLSFAAKRGTLDESERRILGYHMEKGTGSVKAYARDNMSIPLRKLCTTIREIAAGYFLPSSSRSGRFPNDEGDDQIDIDERFARHLAAAFPSSINHLPLHNGADDDTVTVSDDRSDEESSVPTLRPNVDVVNVDDYLGDVNGNRPATPPSADFAEEDIATPGGEDLGMELREQTDGLAADESNGVDNAPSTHDKASCGDELGLLTPGSQLDLSALQAIADESSDSSSSSSSSSDAESTVFEDMAVACNLGNSEDEAVKSGLWKVKGGKFHLASTKSDLHFKCGIRISTSASRLITSPRFLAPRCQRCFSK